MHAGEPLAGSHDDIDGLVLLGGAQSALDDADHLYLPAEAQLVRSFGDAGKPVLGICLGAQLMARAYGAENLLGRPIEFGWHEVRPTDAGRADPVLSTIRSGATVFHWHLDTFTLPPGAVHLAESDATRLQAFRVGRAAYGIQFHFEAGTELVEEWSNVCRDEMIAAVPGWLDRYPAEAARHGPAARRRWTSAGEAWVLSCADRNRQAGMSAKRVACLWSDSRFSRLRAAAFVSLCIGDARRELPDFKGDIVAVPRTPTRR
jgi:GMP synthase-like glutamine amidotransferase